MTEMNHSLVNITAILLFSLLTLSSCSQPSGIYTKYTDGYLKANKSGCECKGYTCGCCVHAEVEKIGLNDTVCVNASYLPEEYGVSLAVILDGKILIKKKISAKNPPPLCIAVPYLKKEASICIRFTNLTIADQKFTGCIDLQARLLHAIVETIPIGCFKIPPGGIKSKITLGNLYGGYHGRNKLDKATEKLLSALMSKQFHNGQLVNAIGLK